MDKANIAVEAVTDMLLSFAFLYRLGEGMSASSRDMLLMFTNPKVLRLLFGWFLGIAYAATGQLYLSKHCLERAELSPIICNLPPSAASSDSIFMAWQLNTFAAFSFEEVKSIVRRHSEAISSGRKPSTHSQDKDRESGNLGSVTTIARKASEAQLAPAAGRKGSLIEVRKAATLDRKTAVMEEGEDNV
ncbi:hypothetical protein HDV00_010500 [Rhizophlyctis rosea]|nr:hypothetical protein HDV00_010500 [Rhizophlyctis rosea]